MKKRSEGKSAWTFSEAEKEKGRLEEAAAGRSLGVNTSPWESPSEGRSPPAAPTLESSQTTLPPFQPYPSRPSLTSSTPLPRRTKGRLPRGLT